MWSSVRYLLIVAVSLFSLISANPTIERMEAEHAQRKFASKLTALENVQGETPQYYDPQAQYSSTQQGFQTPFSFQKLLNSVLKLFTGGRRNDDFGSKQIFNLLLTLIDALKQTFSYRAAQARSQGGSNSANEAFIAGLPLLKAYVLSAAAEDETCVGKFMCQANREAVKESAELGNLVGNVGSSVVIRLLEKWNKARSDLINEASLHGRRGGNCESLYKACVVNL